MQIFACVAAAGNEMTRKESLQNVPAICTFHAVLSGTQTVACFATIPSRYELQIL